MGPSRQHPAIRLLNGAGRSLRAMGLERPVLNAEQLIRAAEQRAGSSDWGEGDWREGLEQLVDALNSEADLSPLGRVAAWFNLRDHLSVRLGLIEHRAREPAVASRRVERPLFILGLPRTGTTILHELMAMDPASRTPASWEVTCPLPPPTPEAHASDPRIRRVARMLGLLEWLTPGFDRIHAVGARLPQECVYLMASAFKSEQFTYMFRAPAYRAWLDRQDMADAYAWHAGFLEHLQSACPGERWVLKTPAHLPHLAALRRQYPDAAIVWTHRRPLHAVASFASLATNLRAGFSERVDPLQVGREELQHLARGMRLGMAGRTALPPGAVLDVGFDAICADPLAVIDRIYSHFSMTLDAEAEGRMRAYLASRPRNRHGEHHYSPATYGLDAACEQDAFGEYLGAFGHLFANTGERQII